MKVTYSGFTPNTDLRRAIQSVKRYAPDYIEELVVTTNRVNEDDGFKKAYLKIIKGSYEIPNSDRWHFRNCILNGKEIFARATGGGIDTFHDISRDDISSILVDNHGDDEIVHEIGGWTISRMNVSLLVYSSIEGELIREISKCALRELFESLPKSEEEARKREEEREEREEEEFYRTMANREISDLKQKQRVMFDKVSFLQTDLNSTLVNLSEINSSLRNMEAGVHSLREKMIKNIETIRKNKNIFKCKVTQSGLRIITKDLFIEEGNWKGQGLGSFDIRLKQGGEIRVFSLYGDGENKRLNKTPHPHIEKGVPCFGNMSDIVNAVGTAEYIVAIDLLIYFLTNGYTKSDCFVTMRKWVKESGIGLTVDIDKVRSELLFRDYFEDDMVNYKGDINGREVDLVIYSPYMDLDSPEDCRIRGDILFRNPVDSEEQVRNVFEEIMKEAISECDVVMSFKEVSEGRWKYEGVRR